MIVIVVIAIYSNGQQNTSTTILPIAPSWTIIRLFLSTAIILASMIALFSLRVVNNYYFVIVVVFVISLI